MSENKQQEQPQPEPQELSLEQMDNIAGGQSESNLKSSREQGAK